MADEVRAANARAALKLYEANEEDDLLDYADNDFGSSANASHHGTPAGEHENSEEDTEWFEKVIKDGELKDDETDYKDDTFRRRESVGVSGLSGYEEENDGKDTDEPEYGDHDMPPTLKLDTVHIDVDPLNESIGWDEPVIEPITPRDIAIEPSKFPLKSIKRQTSSGPTITPRPELLERAEKRLQRSRNETSQLFQVDDDRGLEGSSPVSGNHPSLRPPEKMNWSKARRIAIATNSMKGGKTKKYSNPLFSAAKKGDIDKARRFLDVEGNTVDPQHADHGWTPLFFAVAASQAEMVDFLLSERANLCHCDDRNYNILHIACTFSTLPVFEMIFEELRRTRTLDHFINAKGTTGLTPLMLALGPKKQRIEGKNFVVQLLLDFGADCIERVPSKDGVENRNIVHHSVNLKGNDESGILFESEALQEFLSHRHVKELDLLKEVDSNGWTPLMLACSSRGTDCPTALTILKEFGARTDIITQGGFSVLHAACHFVNPDAILWCLSENVEPLFIVDTCLHTLGRVSSGDTDSLECFQMILNHYGHAFETKDLSETLLLISDRPTLEHDVVALELLARGADVNVQDERGSCLHHAIEAKNIPQDSQERFIRVLCHYWGGEYLEGVLSDSVMKNLRKTSNEKLLRKLDFKELLQFAISSGSLLNVRRSCDDETPLSIAFERHLPRVVQVILDEASLRINLYKEMTGGVDSCDNEDGGHDRGDTKAPKQEGLARRHDVMKHLEKLQDESLKILKDGPKHIFACARVDASSSAQKILDHLQDDPAMENFVNKHHELTQLTPAMVASKSGSDKTLQLLIDHNAQVWKNRNPHSNLYFATKGKHWGCIQVLFNSYNYSDAKSSDIEDFQDLVRIAVEEAVKDDDVSTAFVIVDSYMKVIFSFRGLENHGTDDDPVFEALSRCKAAAAELLTAGVLSSNANVISFLAAGLADTKGLAELVPQATQATKGIKELTIGALGKVSRINIEALQETLGRCSSRYQARCFPQKEDGHLQTAYECLGCRIQEGGIKICTTCAESCHANCFPRPSRVKVHDRSASYSLQKFHCGCLHDDGKTTAVMPQQFFQDIFPVFCNKNFEEWLAKMIIDLGKLDVSVPFGESGLTALHLAAIFNNYKLAELLVLRVSSNPRSGRRGVTKFITAKTSSGRSALFYAAEYGQLTVLKSVISQLKKMDISIKKSVLYDRVAIAEGTSANAVEIAVWNGHSACLIELLKLFPLYNKWNVEMDSTKGKPPTEQSTLFLATKWIGGILDLENIVGDVISHEKSDTDDINIDDDERKIAFKDSFAGSFISGMPKPCNAAYDSNEKDDHGRNILRLAAGLGRAKIVEAIVDSHGRNRDDGLMEMLLEFDERGISPLHAAVIGNHVEIVEKLCSVIHLAQQRRLIKITNEYVVEVNNEGNHTEDYDEGHDMDKEFGLQGDEFNDDNFHADYKEATPKVSWKQQVTQVFDRRYKTAISSAVDLIPSKIVKGEYTPSSDSMCPGTPLFIAALRGHDECAQILLRKGADPTLNINEAIPSGGNAISAYEVLLLQQIAADEGDPSDQNVQISSQEFFARRNDQRKKVMDLFFSESEPAQSVRQWFAVRRFFVSISLALPMLLALTVVAILSSTKGYPEVFYFTEGAKNQFTTSTNTNHQQFVDIQTPANWFQWVEDIVLPLILGAASTSNQHYILDQWRAVGAIRVRSMRVRDNSCTTPYVIDSLTDRCYGRYSAFTEKTSDIGTEDFQKYRDSVDAKGSSYLGIEWTVYNGGGYTLDLPVNDYATSASRISSAKNAAWLDKGAAAVVMDVNLYNPSLNMFLALGLFCEVTRSGVFECFDEAYTIHLFPRWEVQDFVFHIFEGILGIVICINVVRAIVKTIASFKEGSRSSELMENLKKFVQNQAQGVDVTALMDIIVHIFLFICGYLRLVEILYSYSEDLTVPGTTYVNLRPLAIIVTVRVYIMAICVAMYWMICVRHLRVLPLSGPFVQATYRTIFSAPVLMFLGLFVTPVVGFAFGFHIAFGNRDENFATMQTSFLTMMGATFGGMDFNELHKNNIVLGPLMGFVFVSLVTFILANTFIAVLTEQYSDEHKKSIDNWQSLITSMTIKLINQYGLKNYNKVWISFGKKNGFDLDKYKERLYNDMKGNKEQENRLFADERAILKLRQMTKSDTLARMEQEDNTVNEICQRIFDNFESHFQKLSDRMDRVEAVQQQCMVSLEQLESAPTRFQDERSSDDE